MCAVSGSVRTGSHRRRPSREGLADESWAEPDEQMREEVRAFRDRLDQFGAPRPTPKEFDDFGGAVVDDLSISLRSAQRWLPSWTVRIEAEAWTTAEVSANAPTRLTGLRLPRLGPTTPLRRSEIVELVDARSAESGERVLRPGDEGSGDVRQRMSEMANVTFRASPQDSTGTHRLTEGLL